MNSEKFYRKLHKGFKKRHFLSRHDYLEISSTQKRIKFQILHILIAIDIYTQTKNVDLVRYTVKNLGQTVYLFDRFENDGYLAIL